MSSVIVIADHDDPDVLELAAGDIGMDVYWLRLGLPEVHYEVDTSSADGSVLSCDNVTLDDRVVNNASKVLFRRWKVAPPSPMITADVAGDEEGFAQREWLAALSYVLARWYAASPSYVWSRNPSADTNKLRLLDSARSIDLRVPQWVISTRHVRPTVDVVSKGIGTDQAVRQGARLPTTLIELPMMDYLFGRRQPCPVLIQEHIDAKSEIRVGYAYGKVVGVEQFRLDDSDSMVDIRYVPVRRAPCDLSSDLAIRFRSLASLIGLNVFTADLLQDQSGQTWLIDINPDGLFIAADDDRRTLSAALLAGLCEPSAEADT